MTSFDRLSLVAGLVCLSLAGSVCGAQETPAPAVQAAPAAAPAVNINAAAVDAVSKIFTPNPVVPLPSTGKPLATTGSWGVQRRGLEGLPAACQSSGTACVKVLYRVADDKIVCSWTVGFMNGPMRGPEGQTIMTVHPVVLAEDESAALYTMKKGLAPGEKGPRLLSRIAPAYPKIAHDARISGAVMVQMIVDPTGAVKQAIALDGPEMLRSAAVEAAQQWQFEPGLVGDRHTSFRLQVNFNFSDSGVAFDQGMGVGGVMLVAPTAPFQSPLASSASPTGVVMVGCGAAGCNQVGAPALVSGRQAGVNNGATRVTVDAKKAAESILYKKDPVYPAEAKAKGDTLDGPVLLAVSISREGSVATVSVKKGLRADYDKSAMTAVKQWQYKPYLLAGDPVEVETTVTVNFTLVH